MISTMQKEVLALAIKTFGKEAQVFMCIEEMAELTKELSKNYRGKTNTTEIAEEIVDVQIMLEQLKMIYNLQSSVPIMMSMKIANLERRLKEYKP